MGAFEVDLGISPSSLSIVAMAHMLSELGLSPLWGYLVDNKECHYVECIAMLIIGTTSIVLACTSSYPLVLLLTLLNSCGNAATIPVSSKMIGEDKAMKDKQTLWFGVYWSIYYVGALISDNVTVILSMKNIAGVYGWRVCYCLGGYLWLVIAAPVFFWMKGNSASGGESSSDNKVAVDFQQILCIMRKPTFWLTGLIIYTSFVALGLMAYLTMYLQNSGLSDSRAGFAASVVMMGVTFGSATGGFMTDKVHELNGCYGKLSVGAVTVFIRVLAVLAFLWSPIPGGTFRWYHHIYLFVYGITFFTIKAVDISISADLAPGSAKSLTIGLVGAIGGVASNATVVPAVGYLCENKFGYVTSTEGGGPLPPEVMANNVSALRKSMLIVFVVCSIINIALYLVALATYGKDKDKKDNKESCPASSASTGPGTSSCGSSATTSSPSGEGVKYEWYAKVLCFVPAFVQGVNLQLLPICMRAFEITLGLSPSRLSWIPSVQIMFYLGISPLWGLLLDKFKKKVGHIQCIATCICGISCILLGYVSHYPLVMLLTVLNACGNAACIAVAPKMITEDKDMQPQKTLWFGVHWSVYCIGALISANITVSLSMRNIGGVYGWRVCHCLVGYLWLAVAAPIFFWMQKTNTTGGGGGGGSNDSFKEIRCIMQKTTFWLMVCVGYTSQAAFAVLVYLTMYLQSSGVPGMSIGFAFSVVMIGNLAGGFSGGFMTDHIHGLNKCYGKLSVGAVTVFIRVLAVLGFLWSPIPGGTFRWYHHIYLFVYGITFFTIKAVDISISADIAPDNAKSLVTALVGAIGGVTSNATVVPAVGYLCENKFGYVTSTEGGGPLPPEVMANNVSALRNSMLIVFVVCSIINIALYLVALFKYKDDKDKGDKQASTCPATAVPAASGGSSTQCGNSTSSEGDTPKVSYTWLGKVLYHVYVVIDAIDMEILPICMRAFEVSFGCSPATLSVVGAAEQAALLLVSPLWGYLLGIIKPYQVESAAMLVCGMMCILLGTTTNYRMLVLATLIHGATLGCTGPTHQKIITSSVKKEERDTWYGIYTGVYYLGAMASSILASRLSLRNVLGQYGWRLYYCVVGYMWLAAAVPTYYGMQPKENGANKGGSQGQAGDKQNDLWKSIGDLFKKPSYYFMISLIYVSESCELFMGYIVIYLQYCGVRNQMAGFAISVVHMGNMIAGFIGGYAILCVTTANVCKLHTDV